MIGKAESFNLDLKAKDNNSKTGFDIAKSEERPETGLIQGGLNKTGLWKRKI